MYPYTFETCVVKFASFVVIKANELSECVSFKQYTDDDVPFEIAIILIEFGMDVKYIVVLNTPMLYEFIDTTHSQINI